MSEEKQDVNSSRKISLMDFLNKLKRYWFIFGWTFLIIIYKMPPIRLLAESEDGCGCSSQGGAC